MTAVVDVVLTSDDAYEFDCTLDLADSLEILELQGITAGATGNAAVFSRSPSTSPGYGKQADTVARKAPDSQTQANSWAGMCYAQHENIFISATGVKWRVGDLTLRCPGTYNVLDFSSDYVRFTYVGKRVDFSQFLFWLKRFTWEIDADSGETVTVFTFAPATAAPAGVTYVPPVGDTPATGDGGTLYPPIVIPSGNTGLTKVGDLYAFDATNSVVWQHIHGEGVWTSYLNLTTLGMSGALRQATWRVGGNIARVLTTTHHYILNNYSSGTASLDSDHAFPETATARMSNFERSEIDFGIIGSYVPTVGVRADYTTDGGVTWTRVSVSNNVDTDASDIPFTGVWIDPHYAGRAMISVVTTSGPAGSTLVAALYQTVNHGASWTAQGTSTGKWLANSIAVGFQDAGATSIYHGYCDGASGGNVLFKLYRNNTDISPVVSATAYGYLQGYMRCVNVADDDKNSVVAIGAHESNSATVGVFLSRDSGATWTVLITPSTSVTAREAYFVDRNSIYLTGDGGYVALWQASTGVVDLSIPGGGTLRGLMGP